MLECDLTNVVYEANVRAMGSAEGVFAIGVILASNYSTTLDEAFEMGDDDEMRKIDDYLQTNPDRAVLGRICPLGAMKTLCRYVTPAFLASHYLPA